MPALMKLKAALTKLPTAERKVANFIIESPKKASLMVMNEIAEAADVSIPSVTRLARKLGYSGFLEFRVALASSLDTAGKAYDEAPLLANDSDEIFVEKLMKSGARCIEDTLRVLDTKKLSQLSLDIRSGKRLLFIGKGQSGYLAKLAASLLLEHGYDAQALTDPQLMLKKAEQLSENSILIAICRTGVTKCVLESIRAASRKNAACIMISNSVTSPVSALCRYYFCSARMSDIYEIAGTESNIAQYMLLMALIYTVTRAKAGQS
ncbi:MAG: MurR/RpiR family transcriptional regulator [Clostridia bacterium]|nr:MurR/RpiR family transcriptional regulator [Clostridia bacterium]